MCRKLFFILLSVRYTYQTRTRRYLQFFQVDVQLFIIYSYKLAHMYIDIHMYNGVCKCLQYNVHWFMQLYCIRCQR